MQIRNKLYFLHEHPMDSKKLARTRDEERLLAMPGVIKVKGDMCQFDMVQEDGQGVARIKKTTGFATQCTAISEKIVEDMFRSTQTHSINGWPCKEGRDLSTQTLQGNY